MNQRGTLSPAGQFFRALRDRALGLKALSFGLVGVVNSAVDYGLFVLCYYQFHLSIIESQLIAWVVAVTGSYTMNSIVTFAAESGRKLSARTYFGFVAAQFAGFLANTATVLIGQLIVPVWAAKLAAIGASFLVNFTLSNFFVFRKRGGAGG